MAGEPYIGQIIEGGISSNQPHGTTIRYYPDGKWRVVAIKSDKPIWPWNKPLEYRRRILEEWPQGQSAAMVNDMLRMMLAKSMAKPPLFYPLGLLEAAVIVLAVCTFIYFMPRW